MKLDDITEEDIWDIADSSAIIARGLNYYETEQIMSIEVKGKPIQLLNGSNLLHLLEKHGHKAKIDLKEAKQILLEKEREAM